MSVYFFDRETNQIYSSFYMVCAYVQLKNECPDEMTDFDTFGQYAHEITCHGCCELIYNDLSMCYSSDDSPRETYYFYNDDDLPEGYHITTEADVIRAVVFRHDTNEILSETEAETLLRELYPVEIACDGIEYVLNKCLVCNDGVLEIYDGTQDYYTNDNRHFLFGRDVRNEWKSDYEDGFTSLQFKDWLSVRGLWRFSTWY